MEQLAPGDPTRIGAYRLLARLGAGGMGQVYLARNDRGRTVAVKLVRTELAAQESFRERFRHEVTAARKVGGEWTAPVLDADTEAAVPWVATGYVAGPALSSVVTGAHGPLPERTVRILGSGLAHALRSIHGAGLIHRDLKPSNILIGIDGPRVIDFGIARALETATDTGLTRTGAIVGSPGYMSPEQVRGRRVTPAADVFCLGSILAFAATGRLPFGAADSSGHAVMYRIAQEEPDLTGVPDGLVDLVRDCLRKDPAERPDPADVLARTATEPSAEPWLPGALVAELGRHAVRLLEVEHTGPQQRVTAEAAARYAASLPAQAPPAPAHVPPTHVPPTPVQPFPVVVQAPTPPMQVSALPLREPTAAGSAPPPPRGPRRRKVVNALVAVAAVVGLAAVGGVLYAAYPDSNPGSGSDSGADDASGSGPDGGAVDGEDRASPQASASAPPAGGGTGGAVPDAYLGTWRAKFETAGGQNDRTMTITAGSSGEKVMELTGTGPDYSCTWSAVLKSGRTPLELGPTKVESGDPAKCSPGQWSRLVMPDDATVIRELVGSSGAPLRYTKQ
ncbi:serine/threonine-protein kinase [Streptomyces sp. NPDC048057]|uniref:serine/threonine-protein kinase n=1 Tax=Streptomyces sp. NPDC048057 TaxID=3155628 RepID=UPI0033DDC52B